jgi:hypothetical protein
MTESRVVLAVFEEEASAVGVRDTDIDHIVEEILANPFHGFRLIDVGGEDAPALAGFYVRSWKCQTHEGAKLEVCTLHLYLGPEVPVYFFHCACCLEHQVPWHGVAAEELLAISGTLMCALWTNQKA